MKNWFNLNTSKTYEKTIDFSKLSHIVTNKLMSILVYVNNFITNIILRKIFEVSCNVTISLKFLLDACTLCTQTGIPTEWIITAIYSSYLHSI